MQNISLGSMNKLIVHHVGSKYADEGIRLSDGCASLEKTKDQIAALIRANFKTDNLYQFHFIPNLELNPVYQFASKIFQDESTFIDQTQNCARYLYEKSNHPKILSGELCVVTMKDCLIDDECVDGICLFKSEYKDTVLKVLPLDTGLELQSEKGISVSKMDKGCFIFNIEKQNGYLLTVVDNTAGSKEAHYWKDEFLRVVPVKNDYFKTNEVLNITNKFLTDQTFRDFELPRTAQIDLLGRSVSYFKENEVFSKSDFEQQVFNSESMIQAFRSYDQNFRTEKSIEADQNFGISVNAVKKQSKMLKQVLKLDKNFDILIHGNLGLLEKGVEEDGRKFYKIYFDKES